MNTVVIAGCDMACTCCGPYCNLYHGDGCGNLTIPAALTIPAYYVELEEILATMDKYESSRNWRPAPRVVQPAMNLLPIGNKYNRRISPRPWTGRNFNKKG